ncbi:MAG: oligosaccharide flippase family protein [Burkholderiaceae bacterium]|uniref:oligosaccharide flippase family protein n=1 Tax=Denitratimonas sp. CY0512 TaxID=3131940 RepID=UPI0030B08763
MRRLSSWVRGQLKSEFRRNAAWYTGLTGFQRIAAMVQTILIARALGITEYGVYGLLFGTIGLVASTAGLQMGLTATVFVARYKQDAQAKVAAVISVVSRFGWMVAGAILLLTIPFTENISEYLLQSSSYQLAVLLGAVFVGASIVSGIQNGVAQGLELFGPIAKVNAATALLVLFSIVPAGGHFGLTGVLLVTLGGVVLKFALLNGVIRRKRSDLSVPKRGEGVSFSTLVSSFALPGMLVSLVVGGVTWFGMFILSRQDSGFEGVAVVNAALQWRGPVLLFLSAISAVAIPRFSRLHATGDGQQSHQLRRRLALLNFAIATTVGLAVIAGGGTILGLYGQEFSGGRMAFSLIVLSTIPMVVANVYMQELVGAGRMWRQLWMHGPFLTILFVSLLLLVPMYGAFGYALSTFFGALAFFVHVVTKGNVSER